MTHFRPCIDLHNGQVKQIVGGSLSDDNCGLQTNFISEKPSNYYAELYKKDGLRGGHLIKLGAGNDAAARAALAAYPQGLQIGGGIKLDNAEQWLAAGASHVILTSALFNQEGEFLPHVLAALVERIGKQRIVIDLSCRRTQEGWVVAMNRWQTPTNMIISPAVLDTLSASCDEFLIHAADVEGKCQGIEHELVKLLGSWRGCPITYAGGIYCLEDFELIDQLSAGHVDATVGSALDIFGGKGIQYAQLIAQRGWNVSE